MNVAIGEAGEDQPSLGVNEFCFGLAVARDLVVGSDRENFPPANGERFGPRVSGSDGVDAGIEEDGVGGWLIVMGGGERNAGREQKPNQYSKAIHHEFL